MSIYGLRKHMNQYLDKDVQVRAYLLHDLRVPRRAAEVQRRSGGEDEEGKEEGAEVGRSARARARRRRDPGGDEGRLPSLRPAPLLPGRHRDDQARSRPAGRRLPDQGLEHRQAEAAGGQGRRAVRRDRNLRDQLDRRVRRLGRPHHPQEVAGRDRQGRSPRGTPCCRPTRRTIKLEGKPAEMVGGARIDAEKSGGKPKK